MLDIYLSRCNLRRMDLNLKKKRKEKREVRIDFKRHKWNSQCSVYEDWFPYKNERITYYFRPVQPALPEGSAAEPPLRGGTAKHWASETAAGQEARPARHRTGKRDKGWTEGQGKPVIPELLNRSVWKENYFSLLQPHSYLCSLQQGNHQLRQIPFTPTLKLLCSG